MERELWPPLYHALRDVAKDSRPKSVRHPPWVLAAVLLWAALHDRPVSWACRRRHRPTTKLRPGRLPSPSRAVWRSVRHQLPKSVSDVYDRSKTPVRKIKEHHVFLSTRFDERHWYAGPAHLGSYGGPSGGGRGVEASFSLNEKLPREEWLHFGGYPGWQVDVNHETGRIDNGDLKRFQRQSKKLLRTHFSHLHMTWYEEDSLTIHTNASRGWLMYQPNPLDGGVCVKAPQADGESNAEEAFRCVCGIALEFPVEQTVPRGLALQAAGEFFTTGLLPRCVPWDY